MPFPHFWEQPPHENQRETLHWPAPGVRLTVGELVGAKDGECVGSEVGPKVLVGAGLGEGVGIRFTPRNALHAACLRSRFPQTALPTAP